MGKEVGRGREDSGTFYLGICGMEVGRDSQPFGRFVKSKVGPIYMNHGKERLSKRNGV